MPFYLARRVPKLYPGLEPGEEVWGPPFDIHNCPGTLGLRNRQDGVADTWGIHWCRVAESVPGTIYLGDRLGDTVPPNVRAALKQELGLGENIVRTDLAGVVWEVMLAYADPAVMARWGCVMPGRGGKTEIVIAGQRIAEGVLREGHAMWGAQRDRARLDYQAVKARALDPADPRYDGEAHRRYLTTLLRKLGIADLEYEKITLDSREAPIAPRTTVSDNFNRSNENLEASANWSLLAVQGSTPSLVVNGNLVERDNTGAGADYGLYGTALSADDHWSECDCTALTTPSTSTNEVNLGVRLHDGGGGEGAGYGVSFKIGSDAVRDFQIYDYDGLGGSTSVVFEAGAAYSVGNVIRGDANGSTLTGTYNGTTENSGTDTTWTGVNTVGIGLRRRGTGPQSDVQADNWQASDGLSAGGDGTDMAWPQSMPPIQVPPQVVGY